MHRSHRLCHTVERIETAAGIRSAASINNNPIRMRQQPQLAPITATVMPIVKVSQTIINHNDKRDRKMVVAKMQHANAQRVIIIVMTKISRRLTPKRQRQQVRALRVFLFERAIIEIHKAQSVYYLFINRSNANIYITVIELFMRKYYYCYHHLIGCWNSFGCLSVCSFIIIFGVIQQVIAILPIRQTRQILIMQILRVMIQMGRQVLVTQQPIHRKELWNLSKHHCQRLMLGRYVGLRFILGSILRFKPNATNEYNRY